MTRRLKEEGVITELTIINMTDITDTPPNYKFIPSFGQYLTRLAIYGDLPNDNYTSRLDWVASLPSSLEDIYLSHAGLSIWLDKINVHSLKWPFVTSSYGFAPVFMNECFPRLRSFVTDYKGRDNVRSSKLPSTTAPLSILKERMGLKTHVDLDWTDAMIFLFLKKLPNTLEKLTLPRQLAEFGDCFPSHLVHLALANDTSYPTRVDSIDYWPETLFESMQTFRTVEFWGLQRILPWFRNLCTFNVDPCFREWGGKMIKCLPQTLTSLTTISCLDWCKLVHLPRSLIVLNLHGSINWVEDAEDSGGKKKEDYWSFLPPYLTSLHVNLYIVQVNDWAQSLRGLGQALEYLKELTLNISSFITRKPVKTLDWIPLRCGISLDSRNFMWTPSLFPLLPLPPLILLQSVLPLFV
jgi:hypothetical protein